MRYVTRKPPGFSSDLTCSDLNTFPRTAGGSLNRVQGNRGRWTKIGIPRGLQPRWNCVQPSKQKWSESKFHRNCRKLESRISATIRIRREVYLARIEYFGCGVHRDGGKYFYSLRLDTRESRGIHAQIRAELDYGSFEYPKCSIIACSIIACSNTLRVQSWHVWIPSRYFANSAWNFKHCGFLEKLPRFGVETVVRVVVCLNKTRATHLQGRNTQKLESSKRIKHTFRSDATRILEQRTRFVYSLNLKDEILITFPWKHFKCTRVRIANFVPWIVDRGEVCEHSVKNFCKFS